MKTLLNTWFIIGCLIAIAAFLFEKAGMAMPFNTGHYLTTFFAIPVIATIGLWFMRVAIFKTGLYQLSAGQIGFVVAYVALLSEVVLPHFSTLYSFDIIDILLYVVGGAFYYKLMNKPIF